MSEYVSFLEDDHYEGKTQRVYVMATRSNAVLGVIKWFGRWRQYAFFPEEHTTFNPDCMDAISAHVRELMAARKPAKEPCPDLVGQEFCPTCGCAVAADKSGHMLYGGRLSYTDFERILLVLGASGSDVRRLWPGDADA